MSTTFEVCPGTDEIPSFRQITDLASNHLQHFLRTHGLESTVSFSVEVLDGSANKRFHPHPDAPAIWRDDQYAWFSIPGVGGGTDAYFRPLAMFGRGDRLAEEFVDRSRCWQEAMQRALQIGHYWTFRRSAGQPALINVGYGLLACALAELTGGFVYTDDGAWDYRKFPAWPADMLTWYFVPDLTDHRESKDWATRNLAVLPSELRKGWHH